MFQILYIQILFRKDIQENYLALHYITLISNTYSLNKY